MSLTREQKTKLGRANLLSVEFAGPPIVRRRWLSYHRLANASRLRVFRLVLVWRMPWLEHSARAIRPELFNGDPS